MANLRVECIADEAPNRLIVAAARVADKECFLLEAYDHLRVLMPKYEIVFLGKPEIVEVRNKKGNILLRIRQ